HAVERRAQLVGHVGQELRLVRADRGELGGLLLEVLAGRGELLVLAPELEPLGLELDRLRGELLVDLLELLLLGGELLVAAAQLTLRGLDAGRRSVLLGREGEGGGSCVWELKAERQDLADRGAELGVALDPRPQEAELEDGAPADEADERDQGGGARRDLAEA